MWPTRKKQTFPSSEVHCVTPRCCILGCQRWSRLEIFEWYLVTVKTPWSVMALAMPSKCASTRRVPKRQGQPDELNEIFRRLYLWHKKIRGIREECSRPSSKRLYYVQISMYWSEFVLRALHSQAPAITTNILACHRLPMTTLCFQTLKFLGFGGKSRVPSKVYWLLLTPLLFNFCTFSLRPLVAFVSFVCQESFLWSSLLDPGMALADAYEAGSCPTCKHPKPEV